MLRRNPNVLQQDLDGEVLLLLPAGNQVLHLNNSASALWQVLEEPRTLQSASALLAEAYAADPQVVLADLEATVPELVERGVLLTT